MISGVLSGILTAILIVAFLGIWAWAWSKKNRSAFDEMAKLPLEDNNDEESAA